MDKSSEHKGPPNYRPAQPGGPACQFCKYYQGDSGLCTKYSTQVDANYTCDAFERKPMDAEAIEQAAPKPVDLEKIENAFKAGFLLRCAEEGLPMDLIADRAEKALMHKSAFGFGDFLKAVLGTGKEGGKWLGSKALNVGTVGAVGLPVAAGGIAGIGLGKLRNDLDETNVDVIRREGLLAEYERLLGEAQRQAEMKKQKGQYIQLS